MATAQPTTASATDLMAESSPGHAAAGLADQGSAAAQVIDAAPEELNQWKRGFTPQAEIWNGRMAMLGLSFGLAIALVLHLVGAH
jgi:hypothetical protein